MSTYSGRAKSTLTKNVNVRKLYPYGTIIGAIKPGQAFKADELVDGWLHVIEVGGIQPTYGSGWCDSSLCEYKEVSEPVPDPIPIPVPEPVEQIRVITIQRTEGGTFVVVDGENFIKQQ